MIQICKIACRFGVNCIIGIMTIQSYATNKSSKHFIRTRKMTFSFVNINHQTQNLFAHKMNGYWHLCVFSSIIGMDTWYSCHNYVISGKNNIIWSKIIYYVIIGKATIGFIMVKLALKAALIFGFCKFLSLESLISRFHSPPWIQVTMPFSIWLLAKCPDANTHNYSIWLF